MSKKEQNDKEKDYKKIIILLLLLLLLLLISTTVGINIVHNKEKDSKLQINGNKTEDIYDKENDNNNGDEIIDDEEEEEIEDIISTPEPEQKPVIEVPKQPIKTSNIIVNDTEVIILLGQDFDLLKDITIDTGRTLTITSNISDTKNLPTGTHKVIYTAKDINGVKITATRTLKVLNPLDDDDNDGYTNEEELKNNVDPLNNENKPSYSNIPSLDVSTCENSMTVYNELPDFNTCLSVTDGYYGKEDLTVNIDTSNINTNNIGKYLVKVEVVDNLQNKISQEFDFEVTKKKVTITINDKTSSYLSEIEKLTSNELDVTVPNTNIDLSLNTNATNKSTVGQYEITGTWQNQNYDVTFINGTYTITKAIPKYTVPSNLTGEEDATLAEIPLPEGFTYQDDTTVSLVPGTYEFKLTYTPQDIVNYEIVKDIPVEVTITPAIYYTITFVDKDNNVLSTQSIRKNRSAVEPDILEEYEQNGKDYVFSGWIGNYIDVVSDAKITPLYIEESTSTTYAYVLKAKYYQPKHGEGYSPTYYTNALASSDGSNIPLSIKIGGLTESQAESILNQETTIVALNEVDIMKYLTQSTKDQLNAITHGTDEIGEYTIEWYVLKYQADGWHLDGYKIYNELKLDINYNDETSKINLNFTNAIDDLSVTINEKEKNVSNSSGNNDIGNEYTISYTPSNQEQTIVVKYKFKNIEYIKEYIIIDETITEK